MCLKILTLFGLFPKLDSSGDDGVDGAIVLMIQLTSTAVEKIIIMPYIYVIICIYVYMYVCICVLCIYVYDFIIYTEKVYENIYISIHIYIKYVKGTV